MPEGSWNADAAIPAVRKSQHGKPPLASCSLLIRVCRDTDDRTRESVYCSNFLLYCMLVDLLQDCACVWVWCPVTGRPGYWRACGMLAIRSAPKCRSRGHSWGILNSFTAKNCSGMGQTLCTVHLARLRQGVQSAEKANGWQRHLKSYAARALFFPHAGNFVSFGVWTLPDQVVYRPVLHIAVLFWICILQWSDDKTHWRQPCSTVAASRIGRARIKLRLLYERTKQN